MNIYKLSTCSTCSKCSTGTHYCIGTEDNLCQSSRYSFNTKKTENVPEGPGVLDKTGLKVTSSSCASCQSGCQPENIVDGRTDVLSSEIELVACTVQSDSTPWLLVELPSIQEIIAVRIVMTFSIGIEYGASYRDRIGRWQDHRGLH